MLSRLTRCLAVSAAVPALLLSTGSAALAAANSLTVTAVNRAGAKVTINATAVNTATSATYAIRTGKARKLPKGTYAVLTSISTGDSVTLGGKTVVVSGTSRLTVDARQGKRVSLVLSPAAPGLNATVGARICTRSQASSQVEIYATGATAIYVIPNASKLVAFSALGSWTDSSGRTDSYAGLHSTVGVPASPVRWFYRSKMATQWVDARRGPSGSNSYSIAVQSRGGCGDYLYAGMWSTDQPTTSRIHLSAGKWDIRTDAFGSTRDGSSPDIGGFTATRTVAAAKTYGLRFYGSAWGPGTELPVVVGGHLNFGMNNMFADALFNSSGYGSEGGDKSTATLVFGGKTVKVARDRGWEGNFSSLSYTVKKAGWYTLTNTATRYYPEITFPAGMLSTASRVVYRFTAKPKSNALAPVFSLQMTPNGLDHYNRAKPRTTVTVPFKLSRIAQSPDATKGKNPTVKAVTAAMSPDGGKTWRAVPVRKVNGTWTAVVGNPASGFVSLRARATYTSGAYTEVTIIRAYAIG